MAEKEASQSEAAATIDYHALEMEIDREIDSLFVPAVKRAPETTEESKATGQTSNSSESNPGPRIEESPGNSDAGFNVDAIQAGIDKEIDSLFIPAVKPGRDEGPVQTGRHEQPKMAQGTTKQSKATGQTGNSSESNPGPRIEEPAGNSDAGFDLDALNLEIDKEIDSLFIPAVKPGRDEGPVQTGRHEQPKMAKGTAKQSNATGKTDDFPESRPGPRIQESAGNSDASFNVEALHLEIDKEIDSLFVPAVKPSRDEGPAQTGRHEQPKMAQETTEESKATGKTRNFPESNPGPRIEESPGDSADGFDLDTLHVEIDKEIDSLFVPAVKPGRDEGPAQTGRHEQPKTAQETTEESKTAGKARNFPESRSGPRIEESPGNSDDGFDLDTLHVEIDKEIDSLFVPAVKPGRDEGPAQTGRHEQPKMAQETREESKSTGKTHNFPESRSGPRIEESPGNSGSGFDLDALQVETDQETDSLFVPAVKPDRNEGPVQTGRHEQPKMAQGRSPVMDERSLPGTRKTAGPSLEPSHGAASRAKYDESPPDNASDSQRHRFHELSKLIEMFNAAYLSLDWELSRENIQKFLAALHQLEPFAARSADAGSVLRILEVILKRLVDKPHAVNSKLVQLIRDSQGLLAHMLLVEGETGPDEKQRLKDLIERFQDLRRRALAVKAETTRPKAGETAQPPTPTDQPQPSAEDRPARVLPDPDNDPPLESLESVEKTYPISENLEIIGTQIARLRKIETMLARTPALIPIAQRLNEIGKALEDQVDTVRAKRCALIDRISRIKKSEIDWSSGEIKAQEHEGAKSMEVQTAAESQKSGQVILQLTALDGQTLALPASCVLRIAQSSEKKGLKILEKGYATLANFKPHLRGIKSGVLGEWTKLTGKKLRSYRFELVALDSFNQAEAPWQMAVLASDGQRHAILFAEKADFVDDAGIEGGLQAERFRETVETLSNLLVPGFESCSQTVPADQLSRAGSMADRFERR